MKLKSLMRLSPLLFLAVIFSCNTEADATLEYTVTDINLLLEGPLFEGTNDAQATLPFRPEEALAAEGYNRDHIKDIRVKRINVRRTDNGNFNPLESVLLQLTASGASLTSVAVLNPVPDNQQALELDGSQKASLEDLKGAEELFMVMDTNLGEGQEDDIQLQADIIFLLDVKK